MQLAKDFEELVGLSQDITINSERSFSTCTHQVQVKSKQNQWGYLLEKRKLGN